MKKILVATITAVLLLLVATPVLADLETLTTVGPQSFREGIFGWSTEGISQHWHAVQSSEEGYVATDSDAWQWDIYRMSVPEVTSGQIDSVWIMIQIKCTEEATQTGAKAQVMTTDEWLSRRESEEYTASHETYVTKIWVLNNNPVTGVPWTWDDIALLKAGVSLRKSGDTSDTYCRMVSARIVYTPYCSAPTDFTLTESGGDVDITWTTGDEADTTIIVRQTGHYPEDTADGVTVFDGAGEEYTDDTVNLDDTEYYYRAWSENDAGYSTDYAEGTIGGKGMIMIGFTVLAVSLLTVGFVIKNAPLLIAASLSWIFYGFYMFNQTFDNAAMNTGLLVFGGAMALLCLFAALSMWMSRRSSKMDPNEADYENYKKKILDRTRRF